MRYDLDDMYGMLNKYREQDEKHVIQKQEKASHEKNAVLESHLTEKSVPANKMSDQQENPIVEERCYQKNDYEAVIRQVKSLSIRNLWQGQGALLMLILGKIPIKNHLQGRHVPYGTFPSVWSKWLKKVFRIRLTILP